MNKHELGSIACKILGIFLIIQGLNLLSSILYYSITTPEIMADGFAAVAYPLTYLGFGALFWFLAGKLSTLMVTRAGEADRGETIGARELQRIAFSVLGLYFIGDSLPKLVSSLASQYLSFRGLPETTAMFLLAFGGPLTQFIIGVGLFFGSRGLVNLLNFLRKA